MKLKEFGPQETRPIRSTNARNVFCTVFLIVLKWVECIPMVVFTHDITKCTNDQRYR